MDHIGIDVRVAAKAHERNKLERLCRRPRLQDPNAKIRRCRPLHSLLHFLTTRYRSAARMRRSIGRINAVCFVPDGSWRVGRALSGPFGRRTIVKSGRGGRGMAAGEGGCSRP